MSNPLQHRPSRIIATLLIAGGQASDPNVTTLGAWPVYWKTEPDTPDNVITVGNTQGNDDGRDMDSGELNQHWGLQFRFRGVTSEVAQQKAMAVRDWISKHVRMTDVTVDATTYTVFSINKIGQPLDIGSDKPNSMRSVWTLNATSPILVKG